MNTNNAVTRTDIVRGLRDMGIAESETLMLHSSLSAFGKVEGGAPTVVRALLEALGPAGTLVVPTFSRYLTGDEREWNRETTPALTGVISETVRTWPGALRSNHAAHPLAAIGPRAELICRTPHETGFGVDSPFMTMVDINAWYLMMGVTYDVTTLFHLCEAAAQVPYRDRKQRKAVVTIDGRINPDGYAWEWTKRPGYKNDFMILGRELEARGRVLRHKIGGAEQRLFRAADAFRVGMEMLRKDPLYLLSAESRAGQRK